jgi:hypothetical protein
VRLRLLTIAGVCLGALTLAAIGALPWIMVFATTASVGDENATSWSWFLLIATSFGYLVALWSLFGLAAWVTRPKIPKSL